MKTFLLLVCLSVSTFCISQSLNNYKYVLVPDKFEEFKEPNQYRLNGLTQHLFTQNGFDTYLGKGNLPEEALKNNCLVLTAEIIKKSTFFTTKVALQLKNCKGEVIYTSTYGSSREKKYKVAYNEALRIAASHLKKINYKYDQGDFELTKIEADAEKNQLKAEIENLKKEKNALEQDAKNNKEELLDSNIPDAEVKELPPSSFYAKLRQKEGWVDYNIFDEKGILYFVFYSTGKKDTFLVQQDNNDKKMLCFKEGDLWHLVSRSETSMEIKVIKIKF